MHQRWIRLLGAVFALSLVTAACGSGDDGEPADGANGDGTATETEDGGDGPDLTIVDFHFSPVDLTVSDGDTIRVVNIGDTSHTFTTEDRAIDETLSAGEEIEVEISGVETQGFHCRFHSQMTGKLTVQ